MKRRDEFNDIAEWQKYLGNYGEKRFQEECARRNMNYVPVFGQYPYDGLLEVDGQYKKVQIKAVSQSTAQKNKNCISLNRKNSYKSDSFDYLALYVYQYDKFYLIPVDESFLDRYSRQKLSFFDDELRETPPTQGNVMDITKFKYW